MCLKQFLFLCFTFLVDDDFINSFAYFVYSKVTIFRIRNVNESFSFPSSFYHIHLIRMPFLESMEDERWNLKLHRCSNMNCFGFIHRKSELETCTGYCWWKISVCGKLPSNAFQWIRFDAPTHTHTHYLWHIKYEYQQSISFGICSTFMPSIWYAAIASGFYVITCIMRFMHTTDDKDSRCSCFRFGIAI